MVCLRFVGILLNNDTLKQFFIQGLFKSRTIEGVLEQNPIIMAEAKRVARDNKSIDMDYEMLWRKENGLESRKFYICWVIYIWRSSAYFRGFYR